MISDADSLEGPSSGSSEDLKDSLMQNITKRLALFAASAGVALAGLGVLATVANAATDLPPGPSLERGRLSAWAKPERGRFAARAWPRRTGDLI